MATRNKKTFIFPSATTQPEKMTLRSKYQPRNKNISFLAENPTQIMPSSNFNFTTEKPLKNLDLHNCNTPNNLNKSFGGFSGKPKIKISTRNTLRNTAEYKTLNQRKTAKNELTRNNKNGTFTDLKFEKTKKQLSQTFLIEDWKKINSISPKFRRQILSSKNKSRNQKIFVNLSGAFSGSQNAKKQQECEEKHEEPLFIGTQQYIKIPTQTPKNTEKHISLLQKKICEYEEECLKLEKSLQNIQSQNSIHYVDTEKYEKLLQEYEFISECCENLKCDFGKTKENELNLLEKYSTMCQEKEKIIRDSEKESSQQRVKIRLLQEALVKRNEEFGGLKKRNKELVNFVWIIKKIGRIIRKL